MEIKMFNGWYFLWIAIMAAAFFGLYFLLRNKSDATKKWTLFGILAFALVLHFLKCYFPPYSTDINRLYRDIWFINICAANILLFPFIFLSKSKVAKDYMYYLGALSGFLAVVYPIEPLEKANQLAEQLDIVRYYIHHGILFIVPVLMVVLGLHKPSYKRTWKIGPCLLGLFIFIMLNQIFQSELGFVPLRQGEFLEIGYKNTSYIWGFKEGDAIAEILALFCPDFFKRVPVGPHAGEFKPWPWFWLIFPVMLIITPLSFGICMITDHKNFASDVKTVYLPWLREKYAYAKLLFGKLTGKKPPIEEKNLQNADNTAEGQNPEQEKNPEESSECETPVAGGKNQDL